MGIADEQAWLKAERERRDWSPAELARRAQPFADRDGYAVKFNQQLIWNFENTAKKLPGWLRYAKEALSAAERPAAPSPLSDHTPTRSSDAGDTVGIVQLDLSLSMGPGTLIEDFVESEVVSFDASLLSRITRTPADRLRFVTGIGTSHEPKFQHNDQFLIDINERRLTRIDGYYWITFDGAHALKRLRPLGGGRVQVISDNPDYAPMDLDAREVRIEGRAVWFARGL